MHILMYNFSCSVICHCNIENEEYQHPFLMFMMHPHMLALAWSYRLNWQTNTQDPQVRKTIWSVQGVDLSHYNALPIGTSMKDLENSV